MIANLFDAVYDQTSAILDVIAVASIAGAVFLYSRVKAALLVAETAGKSWHEEADAQKERADREDAELKESQLARTELIAKLAAYEARPDLTKLEGLVLQQVDAMQRHEVAAAERTERLITAVESISPRTT